MITLTFTEDAIRAIARIAAETNSRVENIGARRLQTVMATLMEDLLFDLPKPGLGKFVVDAKVVEEKLGKVAGDDDLPGATDVNVPAHTASVGSA